MEAEGKIGLKVIGFYKTKSSSHDLTEKEKLLMERDMINLQKVN